MAIEKIETAHFEVRDIGTLGSPTWIIMDKQKGVWIYTNKKLDRELFTTLIGMAEECYNMGAHRRDEELKEKFFG